MVSPANIFLPQWGFSGGSVVKKPPVNAGDAGLIPGSGRSLGGGHGNPLKYSCLENPMTEEPGRLQSMGSQSWTQLKQFSTHVHMQWTSLVAQTVKSLPIMRETWVQSLGREDPLEKEMATHSSILAWKIPWMEEPGRLQSMGWQRVGHN